MAMQRCKLTANRASENARTDCHRFGTVKEKSEYAFDLLMSAQTDGDNRIVCMNYENSVEMTHLSE